MGDGPRDWIQQRENITIVSIFSKKKNIFYNKATITTYFLKFLLTAVIRILGIATETLSVFCLQCRPETETMVKDFFQ